MGISGIGITELLMILVIVMLIFGTKHLKTIGSDLGGAIKGFRAAMKKDDEEVAGDQRRESEVFDPQVASSSSSSTSHPPPGETYR